MVFKENVDEILRFITLSFVLPLLLQTDVMIVLLLSHNLLPEVLGNRRLVVVSCSFCGE